MIHDKFSLKKVIDHKKIFRRGSFLLF